MSAPAPDPSKPITPEIQKTARENGTQLEAALNDLTEPGKAAHAEVDSHSTKRNNHPWLQHFFPNPETVDRLFSHEHMGNFVYVRATGKEIFEEMPIYVRLGMHVLFVDGHRFVSYPSVEHLLQAQSEKQGMVYDATGPQVLPHIQSFVDQFSLNTSDLLEPDLAKYSTFNEFFSRKLKPTARTIASPSDNSIFTSQADCRITVWDNVDEAKSVWIKGKEFSVAGLLGNASLANTLGSKPSLAVFRLAPEDYHRFHSPVEGKLGAVTHIPGALYSVNPQLVNQDIQVFTKNSRSVLPITLPSGLIVYVVAIGAMLVGSINWVDGISKGKEVKKGDELGWFAYGGSTVICVLPEGWGEFDGDLKAKSLESMEVLVKVGEKIGTFK